MIPGLAVVVAFLLVIVSIMVLVWYVNHIGRSLRVSALIELVGGDTRKLLDKSIPITAQRPAFNVPRCVRNALGWSRRSIARHWWSRQVGRLRAEAASRPWRVVPAGAPLLEISGERERLTWPGN